MFSPTLPRSIVSMKLLWVPQNIWIAMDVYKQSARPEFLSSDSDLNCLPHETLAFLAPPLFSYCMQETNLKWLQWERLALRCEFSIMQTHKADKLGVIRRSTKGFFDLRQDCQKGSFEYTLPQRAQVFCGSFKPLDIQTGGGQRNLEFKCWKPSLDEA